MIPARHLLVVGLLLFASCAGAERVYWNDRLASELVGMAVFNRNGERLGEIGDLALELDSAREHFALVRYGGFLGIGNEVRAFPLSWLAPGKAGGRVTLDVDADELEDVARPRPPGLLLASELLGLDVSDRNGREAGELRDLVVNLGDGRLRHAVLLLQRPERRVSVAPERLTEAGGGLVVDMDAAELQALAIY